MIKMRKMVICNGCGELKPHHAKGLCSNCYQKQNKKICKECGKLKPHHAKGLCANCYVKQKLLIICKNCGEEKYHAAKGLCATCYAKQSLPKIIKCKSCGKLKPHNAFGLCHNCYQHKIGLHKPMHLNKSCSSYLGVVVAEKVLSKVFKNVKQMPNYNKSYDFICSKDMKIDVKSSTLHLDKRLPNYKGRWNFHINKNTVPNYFLCIAFDNHSSLIPQHLWLIPSKKISHLIGLGISKLQTHKWTQYEQPLEKTLECCNELKQM